MNSQDLRIRIDRRRALIAAGGAVAFAAGGARAAVSNTSGARKLVLVILRGAMDGLAAIAPVNDPNYRRLRGKLALTGGLALSDGFVLHPKLAFLHAAYLGGEAAILHAAASPYRDRSHFDAQDVLESGGGGAVYELSDGWLNRALAAGEKREGVALTSALPLVLRGPAPASSYAPSFAPAPSDDTIARLADLYADDPVLGPALAKGVATANLADGAAMAAARGGRGGSVAAQWAGVAQSAAKLLAAPGGPAAAVLSFDGWDTHANQGADDGALAQRLAALDASLGALKTALGPVWRQTVVIVATEFGRTVSINGTGGTDHGTGGAAFLAGGAVKGGRLLGDWPGLANLHEGRDLRPATDLRALFMGALAEHWGLEAHALTTKVFPGAQAVRPLSGLVRT